MKASRSLRAALLILIPLSCLLGCSNDDLGPHNNNQLPPWERLDGPEGGTVKSLALNSNGAVFAGTDGGGIFRSDDGGTTWLRATQGIDNDQCGQLYSDVGSIVTSPGGEVFAATLFGIFSSSDNGATWVQRLGFSSSGERQLTIDDSGHVFVGTMEGLLRSTDGGATWTEIDTRGLVSHDSPAPVRALALNEAGDIFFSTRFYLYRSTDGGNEWTCINDGLPLGSLLNIVAGSAGFVSVVVDYDGLFISNDNGDTWTESTNGPSESVNCLRITSEGILLAGTDSDGLFVSEDGGQNWLQVNNGLDCSHVYDVVASEGTFYAATYDCGVFKSTDNGESWQNVNNGLFATTIPRMAATSTGYVYASTGTYSWTHYGGLWRSIDGGEHWAPILNGYVLLSIAVLDQGKVICSCYRDWVIPQYYILRSVDNGDTWDDVTNGAEHALRLFAVNDSVLFMQDYSGSLYYSTDEGLTWSDAGITGQLLGETSDGTIIAATDSTVVWSTDNGTSWTQAGYLPERAEWVHVCEGVVAPDDALWVTTLYAGILCSRDKGLTWTEASSFRQNSSNARIFSALNGNLFVLAHGEVFYSLDKGASWALVGEGLRNYEVLCLTEDGVGNTYAGTWGNGVMRMTDNQ